MCEILETPYYLHLERLLKPDNIPCDETSEQHVDSTHCEVPPWFDDEKFKRGQRFYHDNIFSMFIAKLCGLLCTLTIPTMLQVLVFTDQSSSIEKSYRRYVLTILHMHKWYSSDFKPGSQMWKSLLHVQNKHFSASRRSAKAGYGHITQRDMALTQFGFMGYVLTRSEMLGINVNRRDDLEGFIHFWRVIGWILGIDDTYNLCRESVVETQILCEDLLSNVFSPALRTPDEQYMVLCKNLLKSMCLVYPLLNPNSFMAFTYYLCNYTNSTNLDDLSIFRSWMNVFDRKIYLGMFYLLSVILTSRLVKMIFNLQIRIALLLIRYLPVLAIFSFGFKKSYVKIYKE